MRKFLWLIYTVGFGLGLGCRLRLGFQTQWLHCTVHSCSWQFGLEAESDSVQCENFCIV